MKRHFAVFVFFSLLLQMSSILALPELKDDKDEKRPIQLADALDWKSIRTAVVSNDGKWLGYQLAPVEGDSEIILRSVSADTEYRFPAGEISGFGGGKLAFSEDSKWAAFAVYPTVKDAAKLKKQKKPLQNNVALIRLSDGQKTEIDKVKDFDFSGENPDWLALHKYPGTDQGKDKDKDKDKDKWTGADLILRELATEMEFNIGNVSEYAFNKRGTMLAWTVDAEGKGGNGIQVRHLANGVVQVLDSGEAGYKQLNWTEEGDGLAVLKGVDDKRYEDPLFSVIGFAEPGKNSTAKVIYDPASDDSFPEMMTISSSRKPVWTEKLDALLFGITPLELKKDKKDGDKEGEAKEVAEKDNSRGDQAGEADKEEEDEKPDLVIWHWMDDRIQPMQQVQEKTDKGFSYLAIYRVQDKRFIRLADEELRDVSVTPHDRWGIGVDVKKYERKGMLDGKRYSDIYIVDLASGDRKLALQNNRWYFGPSPDGDRLLFYRDGNYHTYHIPSGQITNITSKVATSFIDKEDDHNVEDPPLRPIGWGSKGDAVLLQDDWDIWNVKADGSGGQNMTVNGKKDSIRYSRRFVLDRDEKGIDLSQPVYVTAYGEWTKKAGITRLSAKKPGAEMLNWEDATYSRLLKAKNADVFLYTRATQQDYDDFYATDSTFSDSRQITRANPQQDQFKWSSGVKLIDYTSAKGDKLQAALFLPADYVEGQSYPTLVYIYEKMSQRANDYQTPTNYGFNKSTYTSNGYAVLMPDIVYKVNDPGMSAVWCVVPAVEAAIKTGVVDRQRIGIHGHSWGGYQTAFLITQTDLFSAAVAGAPLTNMISMYSSVYWNTGSANQPIFESSQGRFTGGFWEVPEAYTRNSPVFFAQNVKTPLLLLHNDKDGAVDFNQGIEYYNTLRRLDKPVVMLQYKGENHGLRKDANRKDYTVRMREFFDHYLRDEQAPEWLEKGVSHLQMDKHLESRSDLVKKNIEP